MATRLRGFDAARHEPDHPHTNARRDGTRRSRPTPRRPRSLLALLAGVIGLTLGGTLFSAAGAAGASDPLANSVRAIAGAPALGPATGMHLNADLVGIAAAPSGRGYWAVASDGGVFTFGSTPFHGSTGDMHIAEPVVGIAPTPSGRGYWLVGMDGGVFAFGDARFFGSAAGNSTFNSNAPIVGMAATSTGRGYWLVAADGGVFTFGDATFRGSAVGLPHRTPILAIAATRSGKGYYLLASDGGVFTFGDAHFAGAAVNSARVATGIAVPTNSRGYMVVHADGGVNGFGGAPSVPSFDYSWSRHPARGITARRGGGAWVALSYAAPPPPPPTTTTHATTWHASTAPTSTWHASTAPAATTGPSSGDSFLACTRAHESSGNYSINTGNGYYGAYQFLQSTWNSTAQAAGRPDLVGVNPANASPAAQDQLALTLYHQQGAGPWGGRCAGLP